MNDKEATVVGCGALGSHFVQFMRTTDVRMKLIDHDKVEQKNTLSQFHGRPSVGKNKTQSLQSMVTFLFGPGANPITVPHKLTKDNVKQILVGFNTSLVIDCVDNAATRRLIQDFCRHTSTPCLHGALDANGSFGRVCWTEKFEIDEEAGEGQATCENGEHLPFIAITAAYLARAAQIFITTGQRVGFDISHGGAIRTV